MSPRAHHLIRVAGAKIIFALAGTWTHAADASADLAEQNRQLKELVSTQQKTIDEINARMAEFLRVSQRHERELRGLADADPRGAAPVPGREVGGERRVRISAEAGVGYFRTGRNGQYPVGEFRTDDPTVGLEAPIAKNVYLFTELKLLPREANTESFLLGEMYVDFEDVLARWGAPGLLNVRAGRVNVPFGEEYQVRGPIANPLISHALSDIWGCDEGVEIYGRLGPMQYALAVQNGGVSRLHDFESDKSVAFRLSWDPVPWLHLSGSAMRTGRLSTTGDTLSELWFGTGFFRALGAAATTSTFWANLIEADATARWKQGHVSVAIGQVRFDDSDTRTDNARRLRYGYVEAVQVLADPLYLATRYSAVTVPRGYPIAGMGSMGAFFFRPGVLTEELRRVSVGLGYRFGAPLVLKVEYTWESGRLTTGASRNHEDFWGTQLGVKF